MTERRMKGKVAIVTGAGSSGAGIGTGKAISVLFAREGAKVLLVDTYEKAGNETLRLILEDGGDASVFVGDASSADDCRAAIHTAVSRYGKLDTLVNNVSVTSGAEVSTWKSRIWIGCSRSS